MRHFMRLAVGWLLISATIGGNARAQWGFDGWGWGGWGMVGSPESAALQGAGLFAMGAGMYNLNTAQANAIDAQTAMKWNDYVAQITHESARIYAERRDQRLARNRALYDARQQRLRDNPGRVDVENGNALNVAVEDLSDPRLGRSALRAATIPVPASLIAAVPFVYASERITLMLDDLRSSVKWPDVFDDPRFADDKRTFDDLVARIRSEAVEGDISPRLMREARNFVQGLRARVEAQPLKDPDHQRQALRFLTACTSLLGLLEKPNIRPALLELKKIQDTAVGNLLGFMHAYNLRFGAATTPEQRQAYNQLFAVLDRTRNQILSEAKLGPMAPGTGDSKAAIDFFQELDRGRSSNGAAPRPRQPGQPR
jgi:hypothetical protein